MYVLLQDNEFVYESPLLSEACDLHLRLKESGRTRSFGVPQGRTLNMQAGYLVTVQFPLTHQLKLPSSMTG